MGKVKTAYSNKNLVQFGLSTYEMKAFPGAISKGIPNFVRRFFGSGIYIIPLLVGTYYVKEHLWADGVRRLKKEFLNEEAAKA